MRQRVWWTLILSSLVCGCSLFAYSPPHYGAFDYRALPQRINLRLDIYRGSDEHSVLLAVMEQDGGGLRTVFFSPFGHTVASNKGAIPPSPDEMRGNELRPLLDALYQYWSGEKPLDAKENWKLTKLSDGTTKAETSQGQVTLIIRAG